PLGTYPNVESMPPIPTGWLHPAQLVYDMVYNPPDTLLLQQAAARGCATQNGLQMLYEQAEAAWEIFSAPAESGT
ncbi:MAG TPA: shikimate dehydrogenase, partial [Saprospiraceae bacterium]|nr:shikimate dehydrogenase [Saprospiraceae bacterium]